MNRSTVPTATRRLVSRTAFVVITAVSAPASFAGGNIDAARELLLGAHVSSDDELAMQRGGDLHVNQNNATASVDRNVASNLQTGNNAISGGAFANTNGVPMVVQNTGNNVVIQNSTILNLQLH